VLSFPTPAKATGRFSGASRGRARSPAQAFPLLLLIYTLKQTGAGRAKWFKLAVPELQSPCSWWAGKQWQTIALDSKAASSVQALVPGALEMLPGLAVSHGSKMLATRFGPLFKVLFSPLVQVLLGCLVSCRQDSPGLCSAPGKTGQAGRCIMLRHQQKNN